MYVTSSHHPLRLTGAEAQESLKVWEQRVQSARQYFHHGQIECAVAMQAKALDIARRVMASLLLETRPDDCMAAWVVTHHNLADLCVLRGQHATAAGYLCDAHQGLLAQANGSPDGAVQQAAWRHLRETRGALLLWQHAHGPHPGVDAALRATPSTAGLHGAESGAHAHRRGWH